MDCQFIRNVAIIAHVDHGKTTLVDKLLHQSGTLDQRKEYHERVMDSNPLEKERGITILAKTTGIKYRDHYINLVDTPGHADFGGEVERVLTMVDSVLLLVDAVDGPMPQTRFVTQKAFSCGLNPIVVINKVDRPGADPDRVMDEIFELFDALGASDEQLDFPVIYTSALEGWAVRDLENDPRENMNPLLDFLLSHVKPPKVDKDAPFKMQITTLDYSPYLGTLGIGRVQQGKVVKNQQVMLISPDGEKASAKISGIYRALGLERMEITQGDAGDIIAISGSDLMTVSMTVADPADPVPLPALRIDEPTVSMVLQVNDSPFVGREGKLLTTRQVRERLEHEAKINVALKLEDGESSDKFLLKGRGELHLAILLETMRREGFEMAVGRPEVILKKQNDQWFEPFELLVIDVPMTLQGTILEELGRRKALLKDMDTFKDRCKMSFEIPSRGLIGFHYHFLMLTSGQGILSHVFIEYRPYLESLKTIARPQGAMISMCAGDASGYALFNLQERGQMIVEPQTKVYEGMIVGLHSRSNDLVVNVTKGKQLTNMRASGSDENIILTPPKKMTLEIALETINDDELVEITPQSIRLRKKYLTEVERKRQGKD
ncbi:MAG: translational GTPase TypA [Gammaproteobacteria bacterium]|nr:translational GTPase TypA [Gammaproteobacteria bacterium]